MPSDIHLLPHAGCIHKPLLIGERRFLGLMCPEAPPLVEPGKNEDCRLCGHPNRIHKVAYRIRWYLREDQVRNLARHAQCPRCSLKVKNQMVVELHRLRGEGGPQYFTLAEFAGLLKTTDWSDGKPEYHPRRRKGDTPHPVRTH